MNGLAIQSDKKQVLHQSPQPAQLAGDPERSG